MTQDLKLQIMLKAVDKVTRPLRGVIQTAEKLRGQMAQTGEEIKVLEKNQGTINAFKKLQSSARQSAVAMEQQQAKAKRLQHELTSTESPTQKLRNAFLKTRDAARKAEETFRNQRATLAELHGKLKKAGIDTRNLSNAETELARHIGAVNNRMGEQAKKLDVIRRRQQALAKARGQYDKTLQRQANLSVAGMAGYGSGSRVLRGVKSLIAPGIAFEKQMSTVGALARIDKHSDAFKQLQEQAEQLGASTSFSASETAQGMQKLAMAGFDANKIMAAMPGMLNLAKAGGNDLEATADIASNILSGFKLDASQMSRVGDVLAATFTRSNVNLEMMGDTMTYVAPIAQEYGASIEEASALTGLLGNAGIQGSRAGTAMRAMYNNIASHGPAIEALKELGIATRDADGNMIAMPKILAEVARKTAKMGAGDRLAIFKEIAGKNAGAAFARLVSEGGAGAITKFIDVLENATGEARRIAEKMDDNVAGDITKMSSAWQTLNNSIFKTNSGPLRDLIQQITQLIQRVDAWVKENPELAGQLLKIVAIVAAMMAGMGGLALTIAGLLGPFAMMRYGLSLLGVRSLGVIAAVKRLGAGLWWLGKNILPFLGRTFLWLGRVFLMNPIGLAITAIAAAAYLIYRYWEPIKGFFTGLWQEVKSAFDGGIAGVAALIVNWSPLGLFYKAFAGVMHWFGIELPGKFSEFGGMLIGGIVDGIKNKLAAAKEAISGVAESVVSWFKDKLGIHSPSRVFAELGGGISQGVGEGIRRQARQAVNAVTQMGARLPEALPRALAVGIAANAAVAANAADRYIAPSAVRAAPTSHVQHATSQAITIHVHAAPGMNEHTVARMVVREIENQNRRMAARRHSRLYDEES